MYILKNTIELSAEHSAKKGILAEELGERVRRELSRVSGPSDALSEKPRRSKIKCDMSLRDSARRLL